jgi:YegS/Rv2252/BmrU family lipid kinase
MGRTAELERTAAQREANTPCSALVVNVQARSGERLLKDAQDCLRNAGVKLNHVLPLEDPERLCPAVQRLIEEGTRFVIVGGGDGTVSAVAGILAGTEVELGVMPLGTGNDFARNLELPTELPLAAEVIARGVTVEVDVGRADKKAFLNAASLGVSSELTKKMKPWVKRVFGKLAYPLMALGQLPNLKPFRATITIGSRRLCLDSYQVVIGNGRYHGAGKIVATTATLHDSKLDLYVIAPSGAATPEGLQALEHDQWGKVLVLARVARKIPTGKHLQDPSVFHLTATELELETDPAQEVDVDGELLGSSPMRFSVWPRALRVRVAQDSPLAARRRLSLQDAD